MRQLIAIDEAVLAFPPTAVHEVLAELERYPDWWPQPFRVSRLEPLPPLLQPRIRITNGPLESWVATLVERSGERVVLRYDGAWEGQARWSVYPSIEGTRLVFRVDLEAKPVWLRLAAGMTKKAKKHSHQMLQVFRALDKRLAELNVPRVPPPSGPNG